MAVTSNRAALSFVFLGLFVAELLQNCGAAAAASPDLLAPPASFGLKIRDTQASTVSFELMPTCAQKFCISAATPNPFTNQQVAQAIANINCAKSSTSCPVVQSVPDIKCDSISTSCPDTVANIIGTNTGCNTYPLDCYCNQVTPIACAYLGCPLYDYLLAEDWLRRPEICPNAPNVTFDGLPDCAEACMLKSSIMSGCVGPTKSCFCTQQTMFGCHLNCAGTDDMKNAIAGWYATQCQVAPDDALVILNQYKAPLNTSALTRTGLKVHWYEALAIALIGLSLLVLLASAVWLRTEKKKIEKRNALLDPKEKVDVEKTEEPPEAEAEQKEEQSKAPSYHIDSIEEQPTSKA